MLYMADGSKEGHLRHYVQHNDQDAVQIVSGKPG